MITRIAGWLTRDTNRYQGRHRPTSPRHTGPPYTHPPRLENLFPTVTLPTLRIPGYINKDPQ